MTTMAYKKLRPQPLIVFFVFVYALIVFWLVSRFQ